ncbi:MAG: TonB-dependent receptor domain-containing protein [Brevundimonas sp.]|uniref:TonB-dependent receptor domain-containing protein n=1 Tax=Brevundimonas sp. TaxID=1871086 RepID=UPI00391B2223
MNKLSSRAGLLSSTIVGGMTLSLIVGAGAVNAQDMAPDSDGLDRPTEVQEIVITGSRIRRVETTTSAPVNVIDQAVMNERGFIQAGQALNQNTSVIPSAPLADGSGAAAGSGRQYPNLFGLGAGRTLTLVNGRRFVTTGAGTGDRVVDTNAIPVGLLERVDIVQAGGAAVYGSDAIAGVVNYVLRDDFDGMEFDVQYGLSSRNDYPQQSARFTVGRNFLDGRGNVAGSLEWSETDSLLSYDRPISDLARLTTSNPANTSETDGIPALREIFNARFWPFNYNGVIYTTPAPSPALLLRIDGAPTQFAADGRSVVSYDTGEVFGVPFASGGDGWDYREIAALYSAVERVNANLIGHYDLTDRVRLSGELMFASTEGRDPYGSQGGSNTVLNNAASGAGVLTFTRNNPFLSPEALAQLTAASPAFAAGAPLFLSKQWADALPTREFVHTTDIWRARVGLDGDFDWADRNFYWSLSYSRAEVDGETAGWAVWTQRMQNAVNAVQSGGNIVCAINADADPSNDDPACVPINPFGVGTVTDEMRDYVAVRTGQTYENSQDNFLATLGGTLFQLPAGPASFSAAYEYRRESSDFIPSEAAQLGLIGSGTVSVPSGGSYNTNEFSAEVLVPILGAGFNLPFAQSLEFDGAYRTVDNSIAGREDVWGAGLRWGVVDGVTFRMSRSRNFRAPTLDQLFAPSSTTLGAIGINPCDSDRINSGPNPAVRRSNCEALFAANPAWGPLDGFQDPGENFNAVMITSGGNPDLRNELSDTFTYGVILQPSFIPGLTIVADRIEVDLKDGLSAFLPQDFLTTCFDSVEPSAVCDQFTFNGQGHVATANSTTFNAGRVRYEGEVYNVNYVFGLDDWFAGRDYGRVELNAEITHTALLETSVTGFDYLRTDGTTRAPDWVSRYDVRWLRGPLRLSYSMSYLPKAKVNLFDTIESTPVPDIDRNMRHNLSGQYDFGEVTLRAGVINLTDEEPSYPTRNYGDILGRQYFVGLNARF